MKKALFALAAVALASSAFADGTIDFKNRTITTASGAGSYDVPIWADNHDVGVGPGAGTLAGGVTVGLFFNGTQLLTAGGAPVQTTLRTGTGPQFFNTAAQTAIVPGVSPGTSQTLEVRAWQGASYASATTTPGQQSSGTDAADRAKWTFNSKPLGGIDAGGGIVLTPSMTGWGPESGAGLELVTTVPEPTTLALGALGMGALLLRRRK